MALLGWTKMKVLVTGATGFIGSALCQRLASLGHDVNAFYRDDSRLPIIDHPAIHPVKGDITNRDELQAATQNCDGVFHLAAIAKPWASEKSVFEVVNVEGTRNVLASALNASVRRVVFTSTASVFGPATADSPISEECSPDALVDTDYERSKQACESVVRKFRNQGLDIVALYPSRVYGPGVLSQSNALTTIIKKFEQGRWRIIPGDGTSIGNYVFIDDVIDAHISALIKSDPNESYLVGGENLSFNQIVDVLKQATGNKQRMFKIPAWFLIAFANLQLVKAKLTGLPPTITPAFAKKYLKDWYLDSTKIVEKLAVSPVGFNEGVQQTLHWLRKQRPESTSADSNVVIKPD
jgi:nucleoside-diphosphate-sugar epimerase